MSAGKVDTMKLLSALSFFSVGALAANSFSASNLYYAPGLTSEQSSYLLGGLQGAGIKVLRVWLDGRFSEWYLSAVKGVSQRCCCF